MKMEPAEDQPAVNPALMDALRVIGNTDPREVLAMMGDGGHPGWTIPQNRDYGGAIIQPVGHADVVEISDNQGTDNIHKISSLYMPDILKLDTPEDIYEFLRTKIHNPPESIESFVKHVLNGFDSTNFGIDYAELMLPSDTFISGKNILKKSDYMVSAGDGEINMSTDDMERFSPTLKQMADMNDEKSVRLQCSGGDLRLLHALSISYVEQKDVSDLILPHNLNRVLKLISKYGLTRALDGIQTVLLAACVELPSYLTMFNTYAILCIRFHLERCYTLLSKLAIEYTDININIVEYLEYCRMNEEVNSDFMLALIGNQGLALTGRDSGLESMGMLGAFKAPTRSARLCPNPRSGMARLNTVKKLYEKIGYRFPRNTGRGHQLFYE